MYYARGEETMRNDETLEWKTILNRLERVEAQNRRIKRAGIALVAVVGAALLTGTALSKSPTIVEAEEFHLVDEKGTIRAELLVDPDGVGLALSDGNGHVRVGLTVKANGVSGLAFIDEGGTGRATLGVDRDGSTALTLFDTHGRSRVATGVDTDGSPTARLNDGDGKVVWSAP